MAAHNQFFKARSKKKKKKKIKDFAPQKRLFTANRRGSGGNNSKK